MTQDRSSTETTWVCNCGFEGAAKQAERVREMVAEHWPRYYALATGQSGAIGVSEEAIARSGVPRAVLPELNLVQAVVGLVSMCEARFGHFAWCQTRNESPRETSE